MGMRIVCPRDQAPLIAMVEKWELVWGRWKWRAPIYVEIEVEIDP